MKLSAFRAFSLKLLWLSFVGDTRRRTLTLQASFARGLRLETSAFLFRFGNLPSSKFRKLGLHAHQPEVRGGHQRDLRPHRPIVGHTIGSTLGASIAQVFRVEAPWFAGCVGFSFRNIFCRKSDPSAWIPSSYTVKCKCKCKREKCENVNVNVM